MSVARPGHEHGAATQAARQADGAASLSLTEELPELPAAAPLEILRL